jgi:hypothetical protein
MQQTRSSSGCGGGSMPSAWRRARTEQCGLGFDVPVHRALGHAEPIGNVLHLGALVALGDEDVRRSRDQLRGPISWAGASHTLE